MLKIFLIVMACMRPDFTTCKLMEYVEQPDPTTCQLDRVPVSGWWKIEIREQGFPNWSIFTRCEIVNTEQNGRKG